MRPDTPNLQAVPTSVAAAALALGISGVASAEPIKNVVLVHGAFADGSGWRAVTDILERDGYSVSVVQEPETSLADDVAATKRWCHAASVMGVPKALVFNGTCEIAMKCATFAGRSAAKSAWNCVDRRDVGALRHDRTGNARDCECLEDFVVDPNPRPPTKQDERYIGKRVGRDLAICRPAVVALAAPALCRYR